MPRATAKKRQAQAERRDTDGNPHHIDVLAQKQCDGNRSHRSRGRKQRRDKKLRKLERPPTSALVCVPRDKGKNFIIEYGVFMDIFKNFDIKREFLRLFAKNRPSRCRTRWPCSPSGLACIGGRACFSYWGDDCSRAGPLLVVVVFRHPESELPTVAEVPGVGASDHGVSPPCQIGGPGLLKHPGGMDGRRMEIGATRM
ncbi:hypothetical protein F5X99DRAFT_430889 [Biscogniauxia marginata]|nr:hypothetical protein F5X99DRAFT_430889 [Biscogniauxia marginata]